MITSDAPGQRAAGRYGPDALRWTQWNIASASVGVPLESITMLTAGVENGGSGLVHLDDILLYPKPPPYR